MKIKSNTVALAILTVITLISACKSNRNMQASKVPAKKTEPTVVAKPYSPVPPESVEQVFRKDYPSATTVQWTKQLPLIKTENKETRDYKVFFMLGENKNTIIYSEKGELIETRTQILSDQLPQNIHNAIKKQYPGTHIVSAYTVKNSTMNGSYAVIVQSATPDSEKELLLMENGTFVK